MDLTSKVYDETPPLYGGVVNLKHFELVSYDMLKDVDAVKFIMFDKVPKTAKFVDMLQVIYDPSNPDQYRPGGTAFMYLYHYKNKAYLSTNGLEVELPPDCSRMFADLKNCKSITVPKKIKFNTHIVTKCDDMFLGTDNIERNDILYLANPLGGKKNEENE